MAAKKKPAKTKGGKKSLRGKMPVKRSINLVLVDENKIPLSKAIPGILIIVVLAGLFSKFMVADRLIAMSQASARTERVKADLKDAIELSNSFGDIEDQYAHYTYSGMTKDELGLVDRTKVVELVKTILPTGDTKKTWSVTGNVLMVEITGSSLEELNDLARKIEKDPIVDSCTITTADKNELGKDAASTKSKSKTASSRIKVIKKTVTEVRAKYIIYLREPETEEP